MWLEQVTCYASVPAATFRAPLLNGKRDLGTTVDGVNFANSRSADCVNFLLDPASPTINVGRKLEVRPLQRTLSWI